MRRHLSLVWALASKDWSLFWADRRAALFCFAVPVALASAFGLIFDRGPGKQAAQLPLMVVCEDDSPLAAELLADLKSSPRLEVEVVTRAEATARAAERRPGVALVLPAGLGSLGEWSPLAQAAFRPASLDKPVVPVLHHPLSGSEAQWAEGVVSELLMRRIARRKLAALGQSAAGGEFALPFRVAPEAVTGAGARPFNSYSHSFCGMTLQYLLFWGMESGLLLLRERRRSLWMRLHAAPVPLSAVLLGKALATAMVAALQIAVTFAFGYLVFGVTVSGSVAGFILLALAVSGLSAATGLMVAAVGGTEARARSVCILVILAVSMLGGLWLPAFLLPGWARELSLLFPTAWAMRGFDAATWQARDFGAVWPSATVVAAFTVVFLMVAAARLSTWEARRRRGVSE